MLDELGFLGSLLHGQGSVLNYLPVIQLLAESISRLGITDNRFLGSTDFFKSMWCW